MVFTDRKLVSVCTFFQHLASVSIARRSRDKLVQDGSPRFETFSGTQLLKVSQRTSFLPALFSGRYSCSNISGTKWLTIKGLVSNQFMPFQLNKEMSAFLVQSSNHEIRSNCVRCPDIRCDCTFSSTSRLLVEPWQHR